MPNVQCQRPIDAINAVKRHQRPTPMPHKRYKHSERHKNDWPECLINATNAVNLTNVHPKQFLNNTNTVNATKNVHCQCPINTTNAVNARQVSPQSPITTTNNLNATKRTGPNALYTLQML